MSNPPRRPTPPGYQQPPSRFSVSTATSGSSTGNQPANQQPQSRFSVTTAASGSVPSRPVSRASNASGGSGAGSDYPASLIDMYGRPTSGSNAGSTSGSDSRVYTHISTSVQTQPGRGPPPTTANSGTSYSQTFIDPGVQVNPPITPSSAGRAGTAGGPAGGNNRTSNPPAFDGAFMNRANPRDLGTVSLAGQTSAERRRRAQGRGGGNAGGN